MTTSKTDPKTLNVGDKAPHFEAQNHKGENFSLNETLENGSQVLLVFYPKDQTPGCTTQLCGIRDVYTGFVDRNIKVVGVNQGNAASHQAFIKEHGYQFDILVDDDFAIREAYGAIGSFFGNKITKRGVFLINSEGIISYHVWGQQNNQEIFNFLDKQ
jgi:thioredoxin-dependent peroxiredoxin